MTDASSKPVRVATPPRLRPFFGFLHRWGGLFMAAFLTVSGFTGAIISWDHELDDLLNPHLMHASSEGEMLAPIELARQIEARDPRVSVTFIPLQLEPGESRVFGVEGKIDPSTHDHYEIGYNEVFIDPITGKELGKREWGAVWPITTENFVSFLYVLHYTLHIPEMWGIDRWGLWLMGAIAMLWTLDCFVGFYLTLPAKTNGNGGAGKAKSFWSRWAPAWRIKKNASPHRFNFDLHRAASLWTWGLLFIVAFTGFSLNLYTEIFYPVMSRISEVTPSPFDLREPAPHDRLIQPKLDWAQVIDLARAEGAQRGWRPPPGSIFYSGEYGIYGVSFYGPGGDHGQAGVGPPILYYDGVDGRLLGDAQPWKGTAADLFVQAQFPLHSGRILGLPGRILISLMGVVVAIVSITGVLIWLRKSKARSAAAERREVGEELEDLP